MSYPHPLLVEMVAEVHLAPGTLDQAAFFKLVPALQKSGYSSPEVSQLNSLTLNPAMGQLQAVQVPRVRCWSDDRTRTVQIFPDRVALNQVAPYVGWTEFRRTYDEVIDVLEAELESFAPASVMLSTIDRLDVTARGFALCDYLACGGAIVPSWFEDCREAADLTLGRGLLSPDGFNRQVKFEVRSLGHDKMRVQFTSVFHDALSERDALASTLEALHDESTESFESIITERTRAIMRGETH